MKMKIFERRIAGGPSFVEFPKRNGNFSNLKELLEIDWIKHFQEYKGFGNFYQFSYSDDTLMVEYENGSRWYVIAYFDTIEDIPKELQKWKPNKQYEY